MALTLQELINRLQELQAELGPNDDPEVRLAIQPRWAFEHFISIDEVVMTGGGRVVTRAEFDEMSEEERDEVERLADEGEVTLVYTEEHAPQRVVYLGEGSQVGYLPAEASRALGWR